MKTKKNVFSSFQITINAKNITAIHNACKMAQSAEKKLLDP